MNTPTYPIRPRRALLHPLWLAALAMLAANDHVFKGGELLPPVVTGKLSDFAGMLVAPVLLAAVLGLRSRRAFALAHVAVGAVFSSIQILPAVSHAWSAVLASVGIDWVTTMDPTDLVALPLLLVSYVVFGRVARTSPRTLAVHSLELGAVAAGLVASAATSPGPVGEWQPSIFTDVYVHNSGDTDMIIRVRELRPSVDLDCDRVAENPGALLREHVFGTAESWTVPPGVSHGLLFNNEWDAGDTGGFGPDGEPVLPRDCNVVLFDADNVAPRIVFWNDGDPPAHTVDGEAFDPADRGAIEIVFDDEGQGHYASGEEFLHVPVAEPPVGGECAPQADGDRLAWSDVPDRDYTVVDAARGPDGCWAIDLLAGDATTLYVCAPLSELPFAPNDVVRVETLESGVGDASVTTGMVIERVTDSFEAPDASLHLHRGATLPQVAGLSFGLKPDYTCDFAAESSCGTVARAASLLLAGEAYGSAELRPGDAPVRLEAVDGASIDVVLAHAQDRIVLDPECAEGPDTLGTDLEIAAIVRAAPLPQ